MSDHCGDCRYDRDRRSGEDAWPFTTLYWDFLDRHRDTFSDHHRMARQYHTLDRLSDVEALRERASDGRERLVSGTL